jgi:CBS-domain-containing membrane protein
MGSALGLPFDMSQSINNFTTGSRAASGHTVTTTISTQGQSTIALTTAGATDTFKQGDVFTVADCYAVNPQTRQSTGSLMQFCVLADATASGSAVTLTVAPIYTSAVALATVDSFPVAAKAVVFRGAASTGYPQNLILHPDAVTFATADLVLPKGIDMGSRAQADGISIRIIRDYDIGTDRLETRLDVLYGFAVQRDALACRLWG